MNTKTSWKPDWRSSNGHYRDAWEIAFLLLFLVKEWEDNICMLKTIIASSYMDVFISYIIKIKPISFLYFTILWYPQIKSSCVLGCSVVSDSCHPIDCSPARLLSMGFSTQEYWCGLPFPSSGDLPTPGIEPRSSALQADSTDWATREALNLAGTCFPKNI